MIRDEELRQVVDYSEGQKAAAYMILGEIVNLLGDLSDYIIKPTSNKKGREL